MYITNYKLKEIESAKIEKSYFTDDNDDDDIHSTVQTLCMLPV